MTTTQKFLLALLVLVTAVSGLVLTLGRTPQVLGASSQIPGITTHTVDPPTEFQDFYTFFVATTTTATSTNVVGTQDPGFARIGGAKDVLFYFSRGDATGHGNSGSTQFKVQVTPDGSNWFDYNELGQVGVSGSADVFHQRVGTTTISAATSTVQFVMEDIDYYGARCIAVKTTDGEATCKASINF